jgi:tRNA(adenine34) deaminase
MMNIFIRALILGCFFIANDAHSLTMTKHRRNSIFHRIRRYSQPPAIEPPQIISMPDNIPERDIHTKMMGYALEEARRAGKLGEVPIGAIVVREIQPGKSRVSPRQLQNITKTREFELISTGRNLVETKTDASAHAELEAMKEAAYRVGNWRLLNATLYSTLEPCPMCLAAAQAFRCKSVVYGAPDMRLGAVETHIRLLDNKHPYHDIEAIGGVLEDESAAMLRDFFRRRRKQGRKKASDFDAACTVQDGSMKRTSRNVLGRVIRVAKRFFQKKVL